MKMKRSLSVILSLLLTCVILLTSCNTTRPENLPIIDETEATSPTVEATDEVKEEVKDEIKEEVKAEVKEETKEEIKEEVKTEPEVEPELTIDPKPEEDELFEGPIEKIYPDEEFFGDETDIPEVTPEEIPEEIPEDDEEIDETEDETDENVEAELETKDEAQTEAGQLKDNIPASKSYTGLMHYPATNGKDITCNIDFVVDYKALIDGSNKTYSKDLAKLSILYASDIYQDLYIQLKSGATGGSDTATNLGKLLGLQNVKSYKISASSYSVDKNDITEFFVGHKKIVYKGVLREVIIVAVRGTNGTNAEWSSNFDVGADTDEYYKAMGKSHPDWKNKQNHKGFDVAANRVYAKLATYISQYVDANAQTSILLTGHSRGAAIANILGQMFTDNTSYKTYGYTFAAPNTTTAKNAANYKNIFNIINKDDIIPYLPLKEWGFTNYGVTKSVSVRELYSYEPGFFGKEKEGAFKWFIGESYNDDGGTNRTLACFAALATCREDLYKLDTTSHGKFSYTGLLGLKYTQKEATAKYNEIKTKLKNEKLLQFCDIYVVKSGTKYYVEVNYCPAFFMQMLSNMTTGVGDLLGYTLGTKYNDAKLSFIASSGKVGVGGMEHPHMQPTYYLITRNNFLTLDQLNK
jgi:hypothetical protein